MTPLFLLVMIHPLLWVFAPVGLTPTEALAIWYSRDKDPYLKHHTWSTSCFKKNDAEFRRPALVSINVTATEAGRLQIGLFVLKNQASVPCSMASMS